MFRVGKTTKNCQKAGGVDQAKAAVPGHGHPIGALHRCHAFNCDITGLAKFPPEKQTSSHWTVEALCMNSP